MGLLFFFAFCAFMALGAAFVARSIMRALGSAARPLLNDRSVFDSLTAIVESQKSQLAPWQPDSLGLLGAKGKPLDKKGLLSHRSSGYVQSIYQENLAVWAADSMGRETLAAAQTELRSLRYRIRNAQTDIWLDGQPLGALVGDVLMSLDARAGRPLARIERSGELDEPVFIGERLAASFLKTSRNAQLFPRLLSLNGEPSPVEADILLALAVLRAIQPNL